MEVKGGGRFGGWESPSKARTRLSEERSLLQRWELNSLVLFRAAFSVRLGKGDGEHRGEYELFAFRSRGGVSQKSKVANDKLYRRMLSRRTMETQMRF